MKKVFLFFCLALFTISANAEYYDEREAEAGDWAVGLNINQGTRNPVFNLGLGAKLQFYATRSLRLEGNFNGFFKMRHVSYWDTNLNAHYVIYMKKGFSFYPILGATFMHGRYNDEGIYSNREGCFGLNAGLGLQYDVTENLYIMAEGLYKYGSKHCLDDFEGGYDFYVGPRVHVAVGVAYRF